MKILLAVNTSLSINPFKSLTGGGFIGPTVGSKLLLARVGALVIRGELGASVEAISVCDVLAAAVGAGEYGLMLVGALVGTTDGISPSVSSYVAFPGMLSVEFMAVGAGVEGKVILGEGGGVVESAGEGAIVGTW